MNIGLKIAVRRKSRIEKNIIEEIDYVVKFIKSITSDVDSKDITDKIDFIVSLESELDKNYKSFLEAIEQKYFTPFYWEELFDLYVAVKKIFSLLIMYINKNSMIKGFLNLSSFFLLQEKIMKNVQQFLTEYTTDRRYVNELLKNNGYLIKELLRNYLEIVGKNIIGKESYQLKLKAIDVLESIIDTDQKIHDILMKILIASKV